MSDQYSLFPLTTLEGMVSVISSPGLGGWGYALRLAGWPEGRPVWTASLPCQPLSVAGQRQGAIDERHLWPAFHRLIAERRPATIFGEQVASADGREWMAAVRHDLEGDGYAVGCAVLPAGGFGAPHIRYRLFWVADVDSAGSDRQRRAGLSAMATHHSGTTLTDAARLAGWPTPTTMVDNVAHTPERWAERNAKAKADNPNLGAVGDASRDGGYDGWPSPPDSFWSDADWIFCRDGKFRPIEPGSFPLAHGAAARVGRLRAYGNAIVPQVAAEFIGAWLDCVEH